MPRDQKMAAMRPSPRFAGRGSARQNREDPKPPPAKRGKRLSSSAKRDIAWAMKQQPGENTGSIIVHGVKILYTSPMVSTGGASKTSAPGGQTNATAETPLNSRQRRSKVVWPAPSRPMALSPPRCYRLPPVPSSSCRRDAAAGATMTALTARPSGLRRRDRCRSLPLPFLLTASPPFNHLSCRSGQDSEPSLAGQAGWQCTATRLTSAAC